MINGGFLPRLFMFQLLFGFISAYCLLNGYYVVGLGAILVIVAFTAPVDRAYSENPDRNVNGEILTILNNFSSAKYHLYWQAKSGANVDAQIAEIDRLEAEFRKTIVYGRVTDGSENYYSYRK